MATTNVYDMADTWNAGGTTFTAIKMNVTDSASAAGSLLMDLQVGGTSTVSARKDGRVSTVDALVATSGGTIRGYYGQSGGAGFVGLNSTGLLQWTSTSDAIATADVILQRDAANTLALRNGTNAQTFRIYNTWTDGSNFERGFLKWNSNTLEIGTEAAGTGTARNVALISQGVNLLTVSGTGATSRARIWNMDNTATVDFYPAFAANTAAIQTTSTTLALGPNDGSFTHNFRSDGSYELTEVSDAAAPAANGARLYARDSGGGKTQLVVRFNSGAVQVIATEP